MQKKAKLVQSKFFFTFLFTFRFNLLLTALNDMENKELVQFIEEKVNDESYVDNEKEERQQRILDYIYTIDSKAYLEFSNARVKSFGFNNTCINRSFTNLFGYRQNDHLTVHFFNFLAIELIVVMVENAVRLRNEEKEVHPRAQESSEVEYIPLRYYQGALKRNLSYKQSSFLLISNR